MVDAEPGDCEVLLVAVDQISPACMAMMRAWANTASTPVVLVARHLSGIGPMDLVERRVMAVLPRGHVTGERLVSAIESVVAGGAVLPTDVLGELLRQLAQLQREVLTPQGLCPSGLSTREVDVLRHVADGLDSAEIAARLNYSERTVKLVLHRLTTRLSLRSRAHAVAYAIRSGLL
jgi:DNA-binding NarL/FixJ family response regulator